MNKEKEIDLLDIISFVIEYSKRKAMSMVYVLAFCIAVPVVYYTVKEKHYTCSMSVTTNTSDFSLVQQISNPLVQSIKFHKDSLTSSLFNLPKSTINKIKKMEVTEIQPHPSVKREGCSFEVSFISTDPSVFFELDKPTLAYFNENSFVQQVTEVNLKRLQGIHAKAIEQIERLDSVQKTIPIAINRYNKENTIWNDMNLGTLYQEMLSLKVIEAETLEQIDLIDEFKIISTFKVVSPTKGSFFYIGLGIIAGILLNIALILWFAVRELIRTRQNLSTLN